MGASPAVLVARALARPDLPARERDRLVGIAARSRGDWRFWARPEQREPDGTSWIVWAVVAGRGFGKTRTGAEWMLDRSQRAADLNIEHRGFLIGRTAADVRDTMVEGPGGIMACLERRGIRGRYLPGKRRIDIPSLDTELHCYSAMEPDSLRGPEHHSGWGDEPAAWRHIVDLQGNTAWSNAMFGLRLDAEGLPPRVVATTTPKPILIVREWFDMVAAGDPTIVMTKGALYDNLANLAPTFVAQIVERYRDSPLGLQEIFGELVLHVEGALWDPSRIDHVDEHPPLARRIVAVDPPGEQRAECGIMVMGISAGYIDRGIDGRPRRHVYLLDDYTIRGTPEKWGRRVVDAFRDHEATLVIGERNQGGDMVRSTIHAVDPAVPFEPVTAVVDKWTRAEPVSAVYDRVHHVGVFGDLESQMCTWLPKDPVSPDRMDALVHGVRHLFPEITTPPAQSKSPVDQGPLEHRRGSRRQR